MSTSSAHHRHRDRELEREHRLAAELGGHSHGAAHALDHALHHVEPHAAARDLGHLVFRGKARQEEKFEKFELRELVGDLPGDEPPGHRLGAKRLDVDAAAVVGERDVEHACTVTGLQPDHADRWLARGLAVVRRLEPMVEGVADQVGERRLELVEDVTVDAGLLATHLESHLLAEGAGDVTDESRKAADAVGERPHAAHDHLVMEAIREVFVAPCEALEIVHLLHEARQTGVGPFPDPREHAQERSRHVSVVGFEPLLDPGDRVTEIDLRSPEREQRIDEGPQLPCLHE
jgi:hypothetical protein